MPNLSLSDTFTTLPKGGVRTVLKEMGAPDQYGNPAPNYTGCIVVKESTTGKEGRIFLRSGRVYSTSLSGFIPPISTRMLSAGLINQEIFNYLNTVPAEKINDEILKNAYCTEDQLEDINRQMLMSTITHLYGWDEAEWKWVENLDTNIYTTSPLEIRLLVTAADERLGQWNALSRNFLSTTKGNSVPLPGEAWISKTGEVTTPEIASILKFVDGKTAISQIAKDCGFTRFEIAARLAKAIADGILVIPDPDGEPQIDLEKDRMDISPEVNPLEYELYQALSALEDLKKELSAAEDRVIQAQQALKNSK